MTWRLYLLLAVFGLVLLGLVAAFQAAPGYMDADYYYAGGLQLAGGHGFTEPYLWNYLDNPAGVPHPSHGYWMPLASLLAAAGALLFGPGSWTAGRIGFLLAGAAAPPLAAALAWKLSSRRDLAFVAGLLGVFSAFYLPFLPVTDTFSLYMLLGGTFFLLIFRLQERGRQPAFFVTAGLIGLVSGLMHLTRADGLLWLLIGLVGVVLLRAQGDSRKKTFFAGLAVLAGYLLVMTPWFIRNTIAFGAPLGPGGTKMLWLTSYDELFAYPASRLSFAAWWQSGLAAILKARLWALGVNLQRTLAEQGEIFLLPFLLVGLWTLRRVKTIQLAGLAWFLTFTAMTVAFPFAGARGGFFHSGAALQPLWWALAPIGFERVITWVSLKRGWDPIRAGRLFRPALVVLAVLLSAGILGVRLFMPAASASSATPVMTMDRGKWAEENTSYRQVDQFLRAHGATTSDIVMVANPPGFYLACGNPAIAIPDENPVTLLTVAQRYRGKYLVLEKDSVPAGLMVLYDHPEDSTEPVLMGEVGDAKIYQFTY